MSEIKECRSKYARTHELVSEHGEAVDLNCKSWRCPVHRDSWQYRWKYIVGHNELFLRSNKLINLTTAEKCTPEQLTLARQLFCREIRLYYETFEYFAVLEFNQEKTQPHLHLLARADFIPQWLLSKIWKKATTNAGMKPAYIVWIEQPHSVSGSVKYVLDYAFTSDKNQDVPDSWMGRKITYSKEFFYKPAPEIWKAHIDFLHPENLTSTTQWYVLPKFAELKPDVIEYI
jgi:hypothetical protein